MDRSKFGQNSPGDMVDVNIWGPDLAFVPDELPTGSCRPYIPFGVVADLPDRLKAGTNGSESQPTILEGSGLSIRWLGSGSSAQDESAENQKH